MADKKLNYIEFRYDDGSKQCLRGEGAQKWMDLNKRKIAIAHEIDPTYKVEWKWERFGEKEEIPNRPGPVPKKATKRSPKKVKISSEYDEYN